MYPNFLNIPAPLYHFYPHLAMKPLSTGIYHSRSSTIDLKASTLARSGDKVVDVDNVKQR